MLGVLQGWPWPGTGAAVGRGLPSTVALPRSLSQGGGAPSIASPPPFPHALPHTPPPSTLIPSTVGIEADADRVGALIKELEGKNTAEVRDRQNWERRGGRSATLSFCTRARALAGRALPPYAKPQAGVWAEGRGLVWQ